MAKYPPWKSYLGMTGFVIFLYHQQVGGICMRNQFFQGWGLLGSAATTSHLWPAQAVSELQQNVTGKEHLQVAKRQLEQMDPDNKATLQTPALIKDAGGSGETLH